MGDKCVFHFTTLLAYTRHMKASGILDCILEIACHKIRRLKVDKYVVISQFYGYLMYFVMDDLSVLNR